MIRMSISASEQARFKAWTRSLSTENTRDCQQLIQRSTENMVKWAKISAPVDFGTLRSSIQSSYSSDRMGSTVVVNAHYAPYMEFGTGTKVKVLQGYEDYAMQFKGRGIRKVNLRPRPFFFHTYERVNKALIQEFKKLGFNEVDEGSK